MSQQPGGLASREVNEDGTLTIDQINIITALERTSASISMVGVVLVFAAYGTFKRLRTVPSTFVVFASLANIGAGVASMMGFSGVLAGVSSPPCQAQAFMLEM